jgi:hypothetical protein
MPTGYPPSVFVSSTCYDLTQVRLDLKRFIEALGYEAVISESPAFPVNPQQGTIENCINAVRDRTDLFVLIIGTRYGTQRHDGRSVTNLEYFEAKRKELPVYVFVAKEILHTLPVWKANPDSDFSKIVDSNKLFEFVDNLRGEAGHWVYPFEDVVDITEILRSQWALLFTDSLAQRERLRQSHLSRDLQNVDIRALTILLEKPKGWEYRFFTTALRAELERFEGLRRDLQYGLRLGPVTQLANLSEIVKWVLPQLERMKRLIKSAEALVGTALAEALGPLGKPGNPELLLYVAQRIAEVAHQALRWTNDFTTADVDNDFQRLLDLTSNFSKDVVEKLHSFPQLIEAEIDDALTVIERGETYSGEVILHLDIPVDPELHQEIERLRLRAAAEIGGSNL